MSDFSKNVLSIVAVIVLVILTLYLAFAVISDANAAIKTGEELQRVREDVFVKLKANMTGTEKMELITESCNNRITHKKTYLVPPPEDNKSCVSIIVTELFRGTWGGK